MKRSHLRKAAFLLLLLQAPLLFAQQSNDTEELYLIEAYRLQTGENFRLDGRMDEPFWERVVPAVNFTQQEPEEGTEPAERTEVYIAYDDTHLYIAARLYESDSGQILAFQRRRDQELETDDRFRMILDTFGDGRNAYFFETNPSGMMGDGLLTVSQSINLNRAWNGIWDVRTSITEEGWVVEIAIPFRTLDFRPGSTQWGINFQRTIRRTNEEILWAGWRRNQGLFRPQNAGLLTGLEGLSQGLGLEVTPYLAGSGNRTWQDGERTDDLSGDAGFDLSYNFTPGIRTSLTVNTDFAETEVDQRQVNLSRFDIRFPEQRDFFLEGANIFSFVPESGINPYFSRRIGLVDGAPIPIVAGAQVLGRERNTTLGLYQIRTGRKDEISPEDFTAARVRQNIFSESSLGVIYTRRSTLDDDLFNDRHTVGADLELNTSRFMGNRNLQFQAFYVWHNMHTPGENTSHFDRSSTGVRLAWPNHPLSWHISYRQFGEAFNPAVGFAPRVAFRRTQPTGTYQHIMRRSDLIRYWEPSLRFEYLTDLDWSPETIDLNLTPLDLIFESGERASFNVGYNYERLTFDFDLLRDGSILIPQGEYRNWRTGIELRTAGFRRLSGSAGFRYEGFWTGTRTVYELSMTTRPWPGVNLSGDWSRTDAGLPEGDFETDLIRFTGNVDLTPFTAFTSIVQFDNLSNLLGLYHRFRWTLRPGADLFLVHTWNWVQIENRFDPVETGGAIKVNFTHRF